MMLLFAHAYDPQAVRFADYSQNPSWRKGVCVHVHVRVRVLDVH